MTRFSMRLVAGDDDSPLGHLSLGHPAAYPADHRAPSLRHAMLRTEQWLLERQHEQGYWVGELEGDTILESEYILLLAYLGRHDSERAIKAARWLIDEQLPTGGWALYPGGGLDISASVKSYFALKLTGHDPSSEPLTRARRAILAAGGADAVNSFTRFYLAILGQVSYEQTPTVPPEVMLLPKWFPVNLYAVSAWSRTMIVPLSIMSACRPVTRIEPQRGIRELFLTSPDSWPLPRCPGLSGGTGMLSWDRFFRRIDAGLKWFQRRGLWPARLRQRALEEAAGWMIEHFRDSDGLGAIYPPMVWSIIALRSLGHDDESPCVKWCFERLEGLMIEDATTLHMQPCKSPVWDTALALRAVEESRQQAAETAIGAARSWLLSQQINEPGDWSQTVDAEPGGWCFEFANRFYPDLDDTAMAILALGARKDDAPRDQAWALRLIAEAPETTVAAVDEKAQTETDASLQRAVRWLLAMQNRDGGWAAFDKDNDREFLCYVPFADHNAMIDPSTPDLTARVLEALGQQGFRVGDAAVDRAIAYLRRTQEADGSWFGRWGVNYVYGTWQALMGLAAVVVDLRDPLIEAGANWLIAHQQSDGGWGESPASYEDPRLRGQGPVTASQTAWAILGLVAAGRADHPATVRGVTWLLSRQREDGAWDEPEFTGTGFPRVFYLRYHMYPIYFPLLALARFSKSVGRSTVLSWRVEAGKAAAGRVALDDHFPLLTDGPRALALKAS